jgi:hypothetical protein
MPELKGNIRERTDLLLEHGKHQRRIHQRRTPTTGTPHKDEQNRHSANEHTARSGKPEITPMKYCYRKFYANFTMK